MVSVVVPTRNEAGNVGPLIRQIGEAAGDFVEEIIFVDDSDDQTPEVVARAATTSDMPVNLIHRDAANRDGGLGSAVLEGIRAARSDWVLVMDGDLQHPPDVIPRMIAAVEGDVHAVVASRLRGKMHSANATPLRRLVTNTTTAVTKGLFPRKLRGISDPLTGFFLVDRRALAESLEPDGFKILLEMLVKSSRLNPVEVRFDFGDRVSGRSKASLREGVKFVKLMGRLRFGGTRAPVKPHGPQMPFRYQVHHVLSIESQARLPELEYFRTDAELVDPDISVRVGRPRTPAGTALEYSEQLGWAGFAVRIDAGDKVNINVSKLIARSPHVLYTNVVEAVLRWEFVRRGYALVHAAVVVRDDRAYVVTARTDTGKTTTALKLLEEGDLEFLSDDLSIVTPDGRLLTYPKPMTMSNHTVQEVNPHALSLPERIALQPQSRLHSRSGRTVGLGLAKTSFPAATANAIVQFLVPPPKYQVGKILPGTVTATSGLPMHLFVIARGKDSTRALAEEEAAEMLLANCEDAYGFPPYSHVEAYMLSRSEIDLRAKESSTIMAALSGCAATLLQSSTYGWADAIRFEITADEALLRDVTADESANERHVVIDLREQDNEAVTERDPSTTEAAG